MWTEPLTFAQIRDLTTTLTPKPEISRLGGRLIASNRLPDILPKRANEAAHVRAQIAEPPQVDVLTRAPKALDLHFVGEVDSDVRK